VAEELALEHGCCGDNSRSPEGETVCKETIFWGEVPLGCHSGRLGCHSGRLGCHSGRLGCHSGSGSHSGGIDITVGTMVVKVEEGITVVGARWGGFAEQGGQTQPPMSPQVNMDLKVGPGSPEQVEWTYLLQGLHWIEVCPTS